MSPEAAYRNVATGGDIAMTVSTEVDHNDYVGNGVTTQFPYTFRVFKKSDLVVTVLDLGQNMTTLILDTDYTVTGSGGYNGGNVVLSTPLTTGWQISISRSLPVTQETDLRNQGKFFAEVHEDAFDRLTMLLQQAFGAFRLSLRKPSTIANWYDALNNYIRNLRDPVNAQDAATKNYVDNTVQSNFNKTIRVPENIAVLPSAAARSGMVLTFDSSGNPIVTTPASGSATDVLNQLASVNGARLVSNAAFYIEDVMAANVTNIPDKAIVIARTRNGINSGGGIFQFLSGSTDTADNGITFSPVTGSGRLVRIKYSEINVKFFGARGDGVTDDTAAIQAAVDYAKAQYSSTSRVAVFMPSGVYRVSMITVYAFTVLYGEGRTTVLKRTDTANVSAVIYGVNSDSLWGYTGSSATEFVYNAEIHDFTIDGNVDGVTRVFDSTKKGDGIAIWGARYRLYNIDIINCQGRGMTTDYKDQNLDYLAPWFESTIYSIRINNCGKQGWVCDGPHDAAIHDVGIINGSRLGDALYDGFYAGPRMSGNIGNLHVSNAEDLMGTGMSVRHRYAGNIEGPCRFYGGTTFEGARDCVRIASSGVQFDESCTFYIPWGDGANGTVMWIEAGVAFCRIRGKLSGAGTFRPQTNWGIRFRPGTGTVSHNDIDVTIDGCQIPISFGNSITAPDADGGKNRIRILAYYADGLGTIAPSTYGIPNTANGTILDLQFSGNVNARYLSERQTASFSVAAGQSVTWTYKYPFSAGPVITMSIKGPGSTPTNGLWLAGSSGTSAVIFNGTGQAITILATASVFVAQ